MKNIKLFWRWYGEKFVGQYKECDYDRNYEYGRQITNALNIVDVQWKTVG